MNTIRLFFKGCLLGLIGCVIAAGICIPGWYLLDFLYSLGSYGYFGGIIGLYIV